MARRRKKPKRRGYVRPSRAKPKVGWSLRELSGLTGVAPRTIRLYLQHEVLPRPPFKGVATRYQHRQLVWLLAIRRLLTTERLTLAAIRKRLQALSAPEVEALATAGLPPGPIADALAVPSTSAPAATATPPPLGGALPSRTAAPSHVPRWARVELALGLELHVRDDASPRVLDLARRLHDLCVSGAVNGPG